MRPRSGLLALAAITAAITIGCPGPPPPPDVTYDVVHPDTCTSCRDVVRDTPSADGFDATPEDSDDVPNTDSSTDATGDSEVALTDAPNDANADTGDGSIFVGACTPLGSTWSMFDEPRNLPRPVWMGITPSGFAAGYRASVAGSDNVYFHRIKSDATDQGFVNLSQNTFALVEGGAFAFDGTNDGMVFSSNSMGGLDVYFARVTQLGMAVGTVQRVSNDPQLSELAQIAPRTGGWMVVWRSTDDTTGSILLRSQALDSTGAIVGTPVASTPAGVGVGSYRLVSSGGNVVLVYVDRQPASGNVYSLALNATGAPGGTPVLLSSGALATDTVAAVMSGTTVTAAWTDAGSAGILHVRQVDAVSGVTGTLHDLTSLGSNLSKVGIAIDGTVGFALAVRAPLMMGGSIAMVRLDTTLTPRDGLSRVGPSAEGDRVDIAARGDGTYAIGWSDVHSASLPVTTTGSVQVMQCP